KEKCSDSACRVLVVNFALPTGQTCSACILLSNSLSDALAHLTGGPGVLSRAEFAQFMDKERIPSTYLHLDDTLVWIARELHANRVVFGTLTSENDAVLLAAKVLRHEKLGNSTVTSKEIKAILPNTGLEAAFEHRESFHTLPQRTPINYDV